MGSSLRQRFSRFDRRPAPQRRALLAAAALFFALLIGPALSAFAHPSGAGEAGAVQADLSRIAKLVNRELKPPAQRLAQSLPAAAEDIERLREPASTGQAQIRITLDELRQVGAVATLDPHYVSALVAAGRAYVAISGQDPLTATTINPDYRGLEPELASDATQLGESAGEAVKLSSRVKRLTHQLAVARRHARQLERQLQRSRAANPAPRAR